MGLHDFLYADKGPLKVCFVSLQSIKLKSLSLFAKLNKQLD